MPDRRQSSLPDHAAEAAALDIIARFALAQEEADDALSAYLQTSLHPEVNRVVGRRLRFSDSERVAALIAVAEAAQYPLHVGAYKSTFVATKEVRDVLAHGGPVLTGQDDASAEPGVFTFTRTDPEAIYYSLTRLKQVGNDAQWLFVVARRIRTIYSPDELSSWGRVPSDLPFSSVLSDTQGAGWGVPPVCPNGHADISAALTTHGEAWQCQHCHHIRLRDDSALAGLRETLKAENKLPD